MIYLEATSALRLKSYTASTKGPKSTIRIEIETDDTYQLGYLLRQLGEVQAEQKAAAEAAKRPVAKKRLLALPAPEDRA